jgi:hypothetical protein
MLLKEFVIDPELFSQPDLVKTFIRDFGVDKGRILSMAPKDWMRMALENTERVPEGRQQKEIEILISTLQKWKIQKIALRSPSRKNKNYEGSWINFIESFDGNPFDGILTDKDSKLAISPDKIWQDPESWQVDTSKTTEIEAKNYLPLVERLISLSQEIYIIDPYFNLENTQYWDFWDGLIALTKAYSHTPKVIIIVADHKAPVQILGRNSSRLKQLSRVEVYRATHGQVEGGMHDRFILSEVAGFSFTNSFQEKPSELMEVLRLSKHSHQTHLARYKSKLEILDKIYFNG